MQTTQPTVIEPRAATPINIEYRQLPEGHMPHLKISAGACRLNIRQEPSEVPGTMWVTGSYQDPSGRIPMHVEADGDITRIVIGENMLDVFDLFAGTPKLDLVLGGKFPYALAIEAAAGGNYIDLGGLPITRLEITDGAGAMRLDFSRPNPQPMSLLKLTVGAGSIDATNLLNANFVYLHVDGGAASYKLHFGGELRQEASALISSAVSGVELRFPVTTAVKLTTESILGNPNMDAGFVRQEGAIWTRAAFEGTLPVLNIRCTTAFGNVQLLSF